ncbi:MAG TPA: hypothetical protein VH088_00670 [Terriglobales bacterium]|nr:hypothetical protein [Terriglobales bacterium]
MQPIIPPNEVFVVTIKRAEKSVPETYYMPAPGAVIAEMRVRRVAKASDAQVINISVRREQAA